MPGGKVSILSGGRGCCDEIQMEIYIKENSLTTLSNGRQHVPPAVTRPAKKSEPVSTSLARSYERERAESGGKAAIIVAACCRQEVAGS